VALKGRSSREVPKINFREIFRVVRFPTFATISVSSRPRAANIRRPLLTEQRTPENPKTQSAQQLAETPPHGSRCEFLANLRGPSRFHTGQFKGFSRAGVALWNGSYFGNRSQDFPERVSNDDPLNTAVLIGGCGPAVTA